MSDKWSIPKRYLRLSLYQGGENEQSEDNVLAKADVNVNVSFSTKAAVYGMSPEANVTITGLKPDKMAYLATSYNMYARNRIFNSLRLDAGYDNKHAVIYTGTIIEAIPNVDNADYSIDLKCFSFWNYQKHEIISLKYDGKKEVKEICQELADKLGVVLIYAPEEPIYLTDCSFRGDNPVNIMRDIGNAADLNIWLEASQSDKGQMVVTLKDDGRKDKSNYIINYKNIIGAPVPTAQGCEVDIKLDSSIQAGIPVQIESKKFPILGSADFYSQGNKNFFVTSFSHSGQTKGNKWVTHLVLTRENLYEKQNT